MNQLPQVVKWRPDDPAPRIDGEAIIDVIEPGGKVAVRLYKPEHAGFGQTWVRRVSGEIVEFNHPEFVTKTPQGAKHLYPGMDGPTIQNQLEMVWGGIRLLLQTEKMSRPSQESVTGAVDHLQQFLGRRPSENEIKRHLEQSGAMEPVLAVRLDPVTNMDHLAAMREWSEQRGRENQQNAADAIRLNASKAKRRSRKNRGVSNEGTPADAYVEKLEATIRQQARDMDELRGMVRALTNGTAGESASANGDSGRSGESGLVRPQEPGERLSETVEPAVGTNGKPPKRQRAKSLAANG